MALGVLLFPQLCPAPLVYHPGEGWTYESVGSEGKWTRTRAKDQLDVAQAAFDKKDYNLAAKAAERVVKVWPLSDYAPQAQYLEGRCYEVRGYDEKAFDLYQRLLEKYPKAINYQEVLQRQFEIANRFLAGQWFKLWGLVPFFPNMEKTAEMYGKLIRNGPYSNLAPQAQLKIGQAQENRNEYPLAVQAYTAAADRYHDRKEIAAQALFKAGMAYDKQAKTADYDQSVAGKAIATLSDFIALYPNDPRVPEAQKVITTLKTEQARGSFEIAKYYEKRKRPAGALVYYNEVVIKDPNSPYAQESRQRIVAIQQKVVGPSITKTEPSPPPSARPSTGPVSTPTGSGLSDESRDWIDTLQKQAPPKSGGS